MATRKDIRVVLSLDDAGFSTRTKTARDEVRNLSGQFTTLVTDVSKVEKTLSSLSGDLKGFTSAFGAMQKQLAGSIDAMQKQLAGGFTQITKQAKEGAKATQDAATAQIDAKMRVLNNELSANRKLLESRAKTHAELKKLESDLRGQATAASLDAERAARSKKAGSGAVARDYQAEAARLNANAEAVRREVAALDSWIVAERTAQATRVSNLASLEAERAATVRAAQAKEQLAKVAAAVGKSNNAEVARIKKQAADAAVAADAAEKKSAEDAARYKHQLRQQEVRDAREAAREIERAAREQAAVEKREAAEAARVRREEARAIAQMWKGMAAAYGGAKIEQGLAASVNTADQTQRAKMTIEALNLGPEQTRQIYASSEALSNNLRFISQLDVIKSKMSAISSLGYNNVEVIDATLGQAIKTANNLQTLGLDHGDFQTTLRNIYGVVEMRQQTGDPTAINRTFDLLNKSMIATGGKIQLADFETGLRRIGAGASNMSDEGLVNFVSLMDQFKVQGGDGGSGGGISTVGTVIKMMQAYATGKTKSNKAVQEFVGAGILDETGLDLKKDGAGVLKDAKNGNFKDVDLWLKDPVTAIQQMVPKIVAYTRQANNKQRFYQGRDDADVANQMLAVQQYLQRLGITQSAVQAVIAAGAPAAAERNMHQSSTIKGAAGVDQTDAILAKSYARDVQEVSKELTDFKMLVGTTLLPPLKAVLGVINDMLRAAKDFAKDNPMITQFSAIGAAIGGVVLSVKGFLALFGSAGLGAILTRLGAQFPTVIAGFTRLGSITTLSNFGITVSNLAIWIGDLIMRVPVLGAALGKLGQMAGVGGGALKSLGGVFKTFAGLLLAWDIGQIVGTWIASFKVGGVTIGQHVTNMLTKIEVGFKRLLILIAEAKNKALNFLGIDSDAEYATKKAETDARRAALASYEHSMLITAEDNLPKPKAAPKAHAAPGVPDVATGANPALVKAIDEGANKKHGRPDRDPLNEALKEAEGKVNAQKEKLKGIVDGAETIESLRRQAEALVRGKWEAADYTKNHDPDAKKRPDWNGEQMTALRKRVFEEMLLAEQIKAVEFANQRVAATGEEADAAMTRLAEGGTPKQTDAFRALNREMERAETRIGAGAAAFSRWEIAKNRALFQQARVDAGNFAADYIEKNIELQGQLLNTERARLEAELALTRKNEDDKFNVRLATLEKSRAATIAAILKEGPPTAAAQAEIAKINEQALATREALETQYGERRRLRGEQETRALETQTEKMMREWNDVGKAVEEIGANAANGFVGMLVSSLSQGRLAVGDFLKGVLTDIATARLKQTLSGAMGEITSQGGDWLKKNVFGTADTASQQAAAAARVAADTSVTTASTLLASTMMGTVVPALQLLAASSAQAAAAQGAGTVANFLFADGGIMSGAGPLALRKYANGGVANSPQLAVFGEGSMNEAYVPLPDGRSIPVTMQGGAGANVQVNVINQTGQKADAQQGNMRFDGKQYILDVVLTAATTPGGFRSGMKDAMK